MMTDAAGMVDIRRFGAVGDGESLDTKAVQAAINACHEAGGGTVFVPVGTYRIGTIYLKSHVTLHLSAGATLRGSNRREDYNADDVFPENSVFSTEHVTGAHLVIAYRAENATICGEGTIDGGGAQFFEPLPPEEVETSYQLRRKTLKVADWRPGQMVFFCLCKNVSVRDVQLVDSPYWTLFFLGCTGVGVRGVRITNPPQTSNGDGIDIDCCQNVTVSDCIIHAADDSITLRGNNSRLGERSQDCANVAVSNCVMSSPCCGFRIGVGAGVVRDCTISNIVIKETRTGINVVSAYNERLPGVAIDNVRFANMTMDTIMPLNVLLGAHARDHAAIRNLSFANIRALGREGIYIGGNPDRPVADIHLREIDLTLTGDAVDAEFATKEAKPVGTGHVPAALWARHAEGLRLSGFRVKWQDVAGPWQDGIVLQDSSDARLSDLEITPPPTAPDGEAVRHIDTNG